MFLLFFRSVLLIVSFHLFFCLIYFFFFFNDTATTEIYTLSLHDALPIWRRDGRHEPRRGPAGEDSVPGGLAIAGRRHAQANRRAAGEGAGGDRHAGGVS